MHLDEVTEDLMFGLEPERIRKIVDELRGRLSGESRLGSRFKADGLSLEGDGTLIFEAEVDGVAQKKLALEIAAAMPDVVAIVDRVRVKPASPMGDAEILARLRREYAEDPALASLNVEEIRGGHCETISKSPDAHGDIDYEVVDGVVTLNGSVPGLTIKRYIGLLAWWVPGSRDVINGIVAGDDDEDSADRIAEAVRLALEKDPYVDAAQVKVGVRNRTVRLTGYLPSDDQRRMAENDAWYIFGVDEVVNEIAVGP